MQPLNYPAKINLSPLSVIGYPNLLGRRNSCTPTNTPLSLDNGDQHLQKWNSVHKLPSRKSGKCLQVKCKVS